MTSKAAKEFRIDFDGRKATLQLGEFVETLTRAQMMNPATFANKTIALLKLGKAKLPIRQINGFWEYWMDRVITEAEVHDGGAVRFADYLPKATKPLRPQQPGEFPVKASKPKKEKKTKADLEKVKAMTKDVKEMTEDVKAVNEKIEKMKDGEFKDYRPDLDPADVPDYRSETPLPANWKLNGRDPRKNKSRDIDIRECLDIMDRAVDRGKLDVGFCADGSLGGNAEKYVRIMQAAHESAKRILSGESETALDGVLDEVIDNEYGVLEIMQLTEDFEFVQSRVRDITQHFYNTHVFSQDTETRGIVRRLVDSGWASVEIVDCVTPADEMAKYMDIVSGKHFTQPPPSVYYDGTGSWKAKMDAAVHDAFAVDSTVELVKPDGFPIVSLSRNVIFLWLNGGAVGGAEQARAMIMDLLEKRLHVKGASYSLLDFKEKEDGVEDFVGVDYIGDMVFPTLESAVSKYQAQSGASFVNDFIVDMAQPSGGYSIVAADGTTTEFEYAEAILDVLADSGDDEVTLVGADGEVLAIIKHVVAEVAGAHEGWKLWFIEMIDNIMNRIGEDFMDVSRGVYLISGETEPKLKLTKTKLEVKQ